MKSIARKLRQGLQRLNIRAKYKVFYWLWPAIQEDIIRNPGLWVQAIQTGERERRTIIGGVKL